MFMIILEKVIAGLSVITVADLIRLPLVRGKLIFSQFSDKDKMKQVCSYGIYLNI